MGHNQGPGHLYADTQVLLSGCRSYQLCFYRSEDVGVPLAVLVQTCPVAGQQTLLQSLSPNPRISYDHAFPYTVKARRSYAVMYRAGHWHRLLGQPK